MLNVNQLCKKFNNDTLILDNISFNIPSNSIVGLAGASGSGKSTLLRCIQKLEKADSGTCELTEKTGYMFQDFQLFPHMTVLDNLTYAPKKLNRAIDHEKEAIFLLNHLNIVEKKYAYPAQLSGGQKQRVALARSLMLKPALLLCDEPTSGLDLATIHDVAALLKHVRSIGVSMLIASHDLDFLTLIADRILVLKNGKINTDIDPKKFSSHIHYLKKQSN